MTTSILLLLLSSGLAVIAIVIAARWLDSRAWRRSLVAYRIVLPTNLSVDDVAAWLGTTAASTHAQRWALLPLPPVVSEIRATGQGGIEHFLLVPRTLRGAVLGNLRATIPSARLTEDDEYLRTRPRCRLAAEAVMTSYHRPLAGERAETTSRALLASLQPLGPGVAVYVAWILTSAGTPAPVRQPTGRQTGRELPWWLEDQSSRDADDVRAARLKQRDPLLDGCLRVGVVAVRAKDARAAFGRVWGALRNQNAAGVLIVRRWWIPAAWAAHRMAELALPVVRWPMLLSARELVGLLGFPLAGVQLPGLPRAVARQLPPPTSMPTHGTVVATASYVGMTGRPLALRTDDRLRHMWIIGPVGVGKSTLLANLILQDVRAGRSAALLDPKGDLVADVLNRLPETRRDDIVVVSPSETAHPIGLNVLNAGHGEHARELAVDALVHLMASLWRSSFGPRTADVLRNALLTLTHTTSADGRANTLLELPEVLMHQQFRTFILAQPTVPEMVRPFWASYDQMTDTARAQVIGPSLNKLRSFTTRTALRLMLGQSQGVRLDELFTKRRVFLFDLSKGLLGTETAALLGSLIMAGLWQATLERVTVPADKRHPTFIYLDEFQDFLRLPIDLADMLAQARGLGVGLVLAHQYLGQLTDDVKTAVLGTARTQVAFQVEMDDARSLAARFAPLAKEDLTGLPAYEIAVRPCIDNSTHAPVTGRTLPLSEPATDGAALAAASRTRYGVPRAEVEAAIQTRVTPPTSREGFGRQRKGGDK
ncbi:type IV secretory system conjugative DNA transfer family protein [Plantactinospora solaniradicis]|uniref:Type IV secretory system conjugative DNA transfer family protein n=1 Tax=Plantactinospora solaniradicis TaxID=1723736 RepID=A0ABW1KLP5_9ACTN